MSKTRNSRRSARVIVADQAMRNVRQGLWLGFLLLLALLASARVHAQSAPRPLDPLSQAVGEEARKVRDFLVGPQYRQYPVSPALNCAEIYEEIVRLAPRTYNYKPDFYDDPRNAAVGFLGFTFTPLFYAWGYTALDRYSEQRSIGDVNMRIDALRRASAGQDCWVKY